MTLTMTTTYILIRTDFLLWRYANEKKGGGVYKYIVDMKKERIKENSEERWFINDDRPPTNCLRRIWLTGNLSLLVFCRTLEHIAHTFLWPSGCHVLPWTVGKREKLTKIDNKRQKHGFLTWHKRIFNLEMEPIDVLIWMNSHFCFLNKRGFLILAHSMHCTWTTCTYMDIDVCTLYKNNQSVQMLCEPL